MTRNDPRPLIPLRIPADELESYIYRDGSEAA
jgi:hypothetical protein